VSRHVDAERARCQETLAIAIGDPGDGLPAHTLADLLAELATLTRNQLRIGPSEHTFARLSTPTPLQARALELLDIKLTA